MEIRQREYDFLVNSPQFELKLEEVEKLRSAMTLTYDGIVLGIVGHVQVIPGTYEVWLIPSEYISSHSLAFAKLLSYYIREIMPTFDWHRLQMVSPEDGLHTRWAKFLGFEEEGTLRQWGHDKKDYTMWSKVR